MIQTSWSVKLTQQPTYAALGNLPEPSVIYQSVSQHLLVHTQNSSTPLPIRKDLLGLQVIGTKSQQQQLKIPKNKVLLLTRYQLSCLDILNNNEIFTLEFENAERLFVNQKCIFVTCGSDLYQYTLEGEQIGVNHMPSSISCILPRDDQTVIVAMSDMTMTHYKGANIKFDYGKVVGVVCCMDWMGTGVMVGSQDGNIAYYETKKSKWKAKSTHKPLRIIHFQTEQRRSLAIVGRINGNIELRDWSLGSTIAKTKMSQPIIEMKLFDYRGQGFEQLLCICNNGDVKACNVNWTVKHETKQLVDQVKARQKGLEHIVSYKATLQYEISQLRQHLQGGLNENTQMPDVSGQFQLSALIDYEKGLNLKIIIKNGYISGLSFEQPILPIYIEKSETLNYVFSNQNNIAGEINCQAIVNTNFASKVYQIRKFPIVLPRFWKWGLDPKIRGEIQSFVAFKMNQRNTRYLKWMHMCFYMNLSEADAKKLEVAPVMRLRYYNWYENLQMEMIIVSKEGKVEIRCNDLKTLGDIVQDLVGYIGVSDLDSQLCFPKDRQKVKDLLGVIQRLSQTKAAISSEMAQAINSIKFLLVKGESARVVGSIKDFRKSYGDVMQQNRNLVVQITKRNQNTQQLADTMKNLGLLINQTANVRFGEPKTKVVTQCRQAIKNKDFPRIITLMERGQSFS